MEAWKDWDGMSGVWVGWVRGLSESLITRIKGFHGLGGLVGGGENFTDMMAVCCMG